MTAPSTDHAQVTGTRSSSFLRTLVRFPFQPLSPDPLSDVRRTVFNLHVPVALSEKDDRLSIHQGEVFQVQDDRAAACFCAEQPFQFGHTSSVHSAAQSKNRLPVGCSCDPKHPASLEILTSL